MDLPAFDNAAMDGYAVVHADLAGASEEQPVHAAGGRGVRRRAGPRSSPCRRAPR